MKELFKSKKNIIILIIIIIIYTIIVSFISININNFLIKEKVNSAIKEFQQSSNTNTNSNTNTVTDGTVTKDNTTKTQTKKIEFNTNTIVNDWCEFNVTEVTFNKKVTPSNTSGYYTYYDVKNQENTYANIKIAIKNITNSGITADDIANVKLKYDNKYEYTSFAILENGDNSGFDYSNITEVAPLTTKQFHFLAEVPAEVETSGKSIVVLFSAKGVTYEIPIR